MMTTTTRVLGGLLFGCFTTAIFTSAVSEVLPPRDLPLSQEQRVALKAEQERAIKQCSASWDTHTGMTRKQFVAACTRVLGPHK
jgi:hypothetical protein